MRARDWVLRPVITGVEVSWGVPSRGQIFPVRDTDGDTDDRRCGADTTEFQLGLGPRLHSRGIEGSGRSR